MFVRIRPAKNQAENIPQSIKCGKVKVVQGGPGIEIRDTGIIGRIKRIGGDNIQTSKEPFEAPASKGGIIDMSNKKMIHPQEKTDEATGDDAKE
jgi:hypothetical protein